MKKKYSKTNYKILFSALTISLFASVLIMVFNFLFLSGVFELFNKNFNIYSSASIFSEIISINFIGIAWFIIYFIGLVFLKKLIKNKVNSQVQIQFLKRLSLLLIIVFSLESLNIGVSSLFNALNNGKNPASYTKSIDFSVTTKTTTIEEAKTAVDSKTSSGVFKESKSKTKKQSFFELSSENLRSLGEFLSPRSKGSLSLLLVLFINTYIGLLRRKNDLEDEVMYTV